MFRRPGFGPYVGHLHRRGSCHIMAKLSLVNSSQHPLPRCRDVLEFEARRASPLASPGIQYACSIRAKLLRMGGPLPKVGQPRVKQTHTQKIVSQCHPDNTLQSGHMVSCAYCHFGIVIAISQFSQLDPLSFANPLSAELQNR